jgi:hypothetical protein
MARIRTIKPEFWRDESLSKISSEAALLAIGLLNHADDEGYFNAHPKLIESDIFPLRELSNTITVMVDELHRIGYVDLFLGSDGKQYGLICNFVKHQVINKKYPSKIKDLCLVKEDYGTTTVALPTGMERNGIEKEKEIESKEKTQRATRLPTDFLFPKEWADFCYQERPDLNIQKTFDSFKDYWLSAPKGTKLDWFATWRNWVRSQKAENKTALSKTGQTNQTVQSGLTRGLIGGGSNVKLLGM